MCLYDHGIGIGGGVGATQLKERGVGNQALWKRLSQTVFHLLASVSSVQDWSIEVIWSGKKR